MILDSLVNRIVLQLPNKSRQTFDTIEHDQIIKQSQQQSLLTTLIDLSKYKVSNIISLLINYIEETDKLSNTNYLKGDDISIETLESLSFLLQLLTVCMQEYWLYINKYDEKMHKQLLDPPPLDDYLAKRVLNLMLRFIYCFVDPAKERTTFFIHESHISFDKEFINGNYKNFSTFMSRLNTTTSMSNIMQSVGRIIYFISASNWATIFLSIKSTQSHLTSAFEESSSLNDLHLLDYCALNEYRLTSILSIFQANFSHYKKNTLLNVTLHLRKAIWNWIISYPNEFKNLHLDQRSLYNNIDTLFDICDTSSNSIRKKLYMWPLQMDLLIICPVVLKRLMVDIDINIHSNKSRFLSSVKSAIKNEHMSEISVICYIDICTAISKLEDDVPQSPLWKLLPDVENLLQQWIFSPIQPFIYGTDLVHAGITIDHQALISNADVSLLTISPKYCLDSFKKNYLNVKASLTSKIIKLNAIIYIELKGNDNNKISLYTDISLEELADCTRKLLFQLIDIHSKKLFHHIDTSTTIPKSPSTKLTNINNISDSLNIDNAIQNIMILMQYKPQYGFLTTKQTNLVDSEKLLLTIANLLNHPSLILSETAATCLIVLHKYENILLWNKLGYYISTFWKISSQVMFLISQQILNRQHRKGLDLKQLLILLNQLFLARLNFLKSNCSIAPTESCSQEWLQASIGLEVALLISLCTPDEYIAEITTECIGLFCEELNFIEDIGERDLIPLTSIKNIGTYLDISKLANSLPGSRRSYQRKISQILKQMKYCTPGNLAAWEEIWRRWMDISSSLSFKKMAEDNDSHKKSNSLSSLNQNNGSDYPPPSPTLDFLNSNENLLSEWKSYSYFLASLGHVCMSFVSDDDSSLLSMSTTPSTSTSTTSLSYKPNITASNENKYSHHIDNDQLLYKESSSDITPLTTKRSTNENYTAMGFQFIKKLIGLLQCENLRIREHIYEIIGIDMSSAFYPKMIQLFKTQMAKGFDKNNLPVITSKQTLFVEQLITLLRMILANKECADELMSIDIFSLMVQVLIYVDGLEKNDIGYGIKAKLCKLMETIIQHEKYYGLKKSLALRRQLLDYITKWNNAFNTDDNNDILIHHHHHHHHHQQQQQQQLQQQQQQKHHRSRRLSIKNQGSKLYSSSMTCTAELQVELNLACINCLMVVLYQLPLHSSEPMFVSDIIQTRSELFLKYFNFFLNILNTCNSFEAHKHDDDIPVTEKIIRSSLASCKDKIIICLSNLLCSNIDIGLKYVMPMVYHNDFQVRTAFIMVLDNILKQGTEFEVLGENVRSENYKKMVQLLIKYDSAIVSSLYQVCSIADIDDVSVALLATFTSENKVLALLKILIQQEINNTDYETDLFRKTSIVTKCWTLFTRLIGCDYIKSVLKPVINQLKEHDDKLNFELDFNKIDKDTIEINKKNIITATNLILDAICNSVNKIPIEFRFICNFVMKATKNRFPDAIYKGVSSFIFLRFFCPVLATPEMEDLIESNVISVKLRRSLLFIAKTIQNLANGVLFGKKEAYLEILNDYMADNIPRVAHFLEDISTVADDEQYPIDDYPLQMVEEDYHTLQRILGKYIDDIQKNITSEHLLMLLDNDLMPSFENFIYEINKVLDQLGPPSERTKTIEFNYMNRRKTYSNENPKYTEFMLNYRNKNVETIASEDIIYSGGISKAGRKVVYIIYRRIQSQNSDLGLLLYHLLKELEKVADKPFIIIIDVTQYGPQNRLPPSFMQQLIAIIPESVLENISTIIVYNTNNFYKKYLSEAQTTLFHLLSKKTVFATALEEIYQYIDPQEIKLPKSTLGLSLEKCVEFSDAKRVWSSNIETPLLIKITFEFIQLLSMRKHEVLPGMRSITNDVYDLSDLQIISGTDAHYNQPNRIYLVSTADNIEICIHSSQSKEIYDLLLNNKQKYETIKPSGSNRIIRPNDVPGRLLNMAFLNLTNDNFKLRLSAYHLLQTLCQKFGYCNFVNILDTKEICLPNNCIKLVVDISECLASLEQHLTLEFLNEVFIGIEKTTIEQQYSCILYVIPWIKNLGITYTGSPEEITKTKNLLSVIIKATFTIDMHKIMQVRLWNALGEVDEIKNILLESSIDVALQYGIGSKESEYIADTLISISNITLRSKLMAYTLRTLRRTVIKPTRSLIDHPLWTEIAILVRFNLMLSFDNHGPLKNYVPDVLHVITLLIGVGSTFIRTSIYGLIVNLIQTLCMSSSLPEMNKQELQKLIAHEDGKRSQLMYGLVNPHADAFTINSETLTDPLSGPLDLNVLENLIKSLLRVVELGAPNTDIANAWRSRWLSHITSEAFQPNPAIQPRTIIALGYLGGNQIDDNIIYQVLVTLKNALLSFDPDDTYLVLSVLKCLQNLVENTSVHSRYLISLFWIAIGIISINHSDLNFIGMDFLSSVICAMDRENIFDDENIIMENILLKARESVDELYKEIDELCGVNFETHFSFAVVGLLIKGWGKTPQVKINYNQCLVNLLKCATKHPQKNINTQALGYIAGLQSIAKRMETKKNMYCFVGLCWLVDDNNNKDDDDDQYNDNESMGKRKKGSYLSENDIFNNEHDIFSSSTLVNSNLNNLDSQNPDAVNKNTIFNKLNIHDPTTALLFITCLATQLTITDNNDEQNYLYDILAEAATYMPHVFSIVYPTILNRMNQHMLETNNLTTLNFIQHIFISICSHSNIHQQKTNITDDLNKLGFPALHDINYGISSNSTITITSLLGQIIERFING